MSSKSLSDQTCIETADLRSIGIVSNNTEDSSSISSKSVVDDISNNEGVNISEDGDDSGEMSKNKKKCTSGEHTSNNNQNQNIDRREELRETELHDEQLFKQPPQLLEDCPLCYLRMPLLASGGVYMTCCGKVICSGCIHAPVYDDQGNIVEKKCPFCRTSYPSSDEAIINRLKKRIEAGDARAMFNLGVYHYNGQCGLPQDYNKVFAFHHRAAELGYAKAYTSIGHAYCTGRGVVVDKKMAIHYFELAAMRGEASARHNLGFTEFQRGNVNRALKHYLIAVRDGHDGSLKNIQQLYSDGHVPKDEYAKALRLYQEYLVEVKSDQRDKADAANDKFRYY